MILLQFVTKYALAGIFPAGAIFIFQCHDILFTKRVIMIIRRINDNTISCIITPEDLREKGFRLDDLFERKKEAVEFIRSTVLEAARQENFNLEGELTTMRISVLPDHSLSLLITREDSRDGALREVHRIAKSIFESMKAKAAEDGEEGQQAGEDPESPDSLVKALLSDASSEENGSGENSGADSEVTDSYMFSFYSIRDAMDCCKVFADAGPLESSLYYLQEDETYFLILRRTKQTPAGFAKNILSANEFGELVTSREQFISYVTEHGVCIAKEHAVEMFMDVMPGITIPRIRE